MKNTLLVMMTIVSSSLLANTAFEGSWKTNCSVSQTANEVLKVQFQGNQVTYDDVQFADNTCKKPRATGHVEATVALPTDDAATKLDLTYTAITLALNDAATVQLANMMELCGMSDWALNIPKNVAGKNCANEITFPNIGEIYYSIAGFSAEEDLLLGLTTAELDGTTPEKRPVDLDVDNPFFKQS